MSEDRESKFVRWSVFSWIIGIITAALLFLAQAQVAESNALKAHENAQRTYEETVIQLKQQLTDLQITVTARLDKIATKLDTIH